jgi:hypothetical protein
MPDFELPEMAKGGGLHEKELHAAPCLGGLISMTVDVFYLAL